MLRRRKNIPNKRTYSGVEMVYVTDTIFKINRPAFVIPENSERENNFLKTPEDLEIERFTAVPYAFFDRSAWDDIGRGISSAELELKDGEPARLVPFSLNTSEERNSILRKIVFKSFVLPFPNEITEDHEHDSDNDELEIGITHEQFEHLLGI